MLLSAATFVACNIEQGSTGPRLPDNPGSNPQFRNAAFIADVDLRSGVIKILEPAANVTPGAPSLMMNSMSGSGVPAYSILAGDVVELTTSNLTASALHQFTQDKVRIQFDVTVTNQLTSVQLITPTFPTPPAGVTGVLLFPFENVTIVTSGGTTVGGDGTEVIVEQPSRGAVAPSVDWEGAPHNFFNDVGCSGAGANDCYRYQTYGSPLAAGATSEVQRVGFDIDPTVGRFRARLIVAADLANSGPQQFGTVAGTVTSPQRGALTGVTVSVQTGGFTGTTAAGGAYSIPNVSLGPKTVSITAGLPAGCTAPASQNTTVNPNATSTVNFSVTCTVPSGTLTGTVSSSLGGPLANVGVNATPTGGSLVGPATTNASGVYTLASVPVNTSANGNITLTNLPANCTNPGPIPYSGLLENETQTENITVSCTAPPQGYQYTATWGAISGSTVTLTLAIDLSTFNDPAINGANPDDIASAQGTLTYNASRLTFASAAQAAGSQMNQVVANAASPGSINWGSFSTIAGLKTGSVGLITITFNIIGTGPTSVTTGGTFVLAESNGGADLIPRIIRTEGTITIP